MTKVVVISSNIRWLALCLPLLAWCTGTGAESGTAAMFRYSPSHTAELAAGPVELGGLAWRFTTGGEVRSTPAVAGGIAVFGSNDGFLYAVELKTGVEKWKAAVGGDVSSSPAIVRDTVIVLGRDGRLRALRLNDGSPVWSFATGPDLSLGEDPRMFDLWVSSPVVADDAVYVGSGDGKVYSVALSTGVKRWSYATQSRVRSSPAIADGTLYVGSFDGQVYALDATSGAERWKFQTGDAVQSSPAVFGGTVCVGSRATAFFGLNAKNGALQWRHPHSGSWILSSAAVSAGKVIFGGSDSHLFEALDVRTGEPVWSMPVGARILGSATVVGNVVVYGAEDFRTYTLDLATGLGLSMEFTEGPIYSSVVPVDGLVLVGSDDHHLYAFKTHPAASLAESASPDLLRAAQGRYRTEGGEVYSLSLHHGRLGLTYCTYPPALVVVQADGSLVCPMLWGTTGKIRREPGKPASALVLSTFGRESVAERWLENSL